MLAELLDAQWATDPHQIKLWHGGYELVEPGDSVLHYMKADGQLLAVAIRKKKTRTEEQQDGRT